ncbi:MAG: radical SAM family heme chaperone HemW [Clostridia bacterium]|nr:radical SAM family heme chaperone HemW [Clostridia bacterium]
MKREPIGLYLHIPFCRSKCPYCDFCSYPRPTNELMESYTHELVRRIREAGKTYGETLPASVSHSGEGTTSRRLTLDTVYFGGGTPTLLPPSCIRELFAAIREAFVILPDAEITVEGNPAAAGREALSVWRECGVNRLSLGSQSAQANELKALGRLHRWEDVEKTVTDARAVGIENINLDFMLGIPHQTPASLADTLSRALALEPTHLSAYTLMLEEGTPFHRRGRAALGLPQNEEEADEQAVTLWEQACAILQEAGYEHYEISNFARSGFRSRHNLHTWQCRDYLGLGVAAHSCMNGVRFGQSRDLEGFLAGKDITEFTEILTPADRESECIMLALRLSDGIDEQEFSNRFDKDFWHTYGHICIPFIEKGLMGREGGRVYLTEAGFPVSNAILAELI